MRSIDTNLLHFARYQARRFIEPSLSNALCEPPPVAKLQITTPPEMKQEQTPQSMETKAVQVGER
jgi:hypothetical protein